MSEAALEADLLRLRESLDPAGVPWALAAGAAVYLYARNRPPTDLDVLVRPGDLPVVGEILKISPRIETTPWGEAHKIEPHGIEVSGLLVVRVGGGSFSYWMDDEMVDRLWHLDYDGVIVPVLAPEDLVALKVVLQRGPEQGKHDFEDVDALASRVELDFGYLRRRLRIMGAESRALSFLAGRGWAP